MYGLEKSLGFKISKISNKINNKFNKLLQKYDIALEQRATIEIIKYRKDVNQTEIAAILEKDKTTISRTLASLEKKGFIFKNQIDKRTNLIEITPKAEKMLEESSEIVNEFRQSLYTNLNEDEAKTLINLLDKVELSVKDN